MSVYFSEKSKTSGLFVAQAEGINVWSKDAEATAKTI